MMSHLISILVCMLSAIDAKSIWDPFCKDDILYKPYVRVFHKGRSGILLRDRGPGFIDLSGLKDIYVCTNGLVMFYYARTKSMGDLFEHGQLQWAPHYCELYNPTSNSGIVPDHPKKTLLSILLMGHPQDYRRAALQMFVAPAFDKYYGDYINLTSLIMIGTQGECLIEKGAEKARLRVRNQLPKYVADIPWNKPRPPMFCQLDAMRNLGQQGIITLSKPGYAGWEGDLFEFKARKMGFRGTELETKHKQKYETGSAIQPRFFASSLKGGLIPDALGAFADVADEVYAALIHDRKMEFIGCHTYPDFTYEQIMLLEKRKLYYEQIRLPGESLLIKETEPPFWAQQIPVPGPDNSSMAMVSRYSLYIGVDVNVTDIETYAEAKMKVDNATADLKSKILAGAEAAEIKAGELLLKKETIMYSLWPLKKAYADLFKYVGELELQLQKAVLTIHGITGCPTDIGALPPTVDVDMTKIEDELPVLVAHYKKLLLKTASQKKSEMRLEPYDRKLIEEYDDLVKKIAILGDILTKRSTALGPLISNSESLRSRFVLYKRMLKKTLKDLEMAVSKIERTGKPFDQVVRDPFERYFVDMMIEITDGVNEDMTPNPDRQADACQELPFGPIYCEAIKPTSERAGQLLYNRQSKGKTWSEDDAWRGKVLGLLEDIFQSVCPYVEADFASSITKMLTGYLLAEPLGTGVLQPMYGSRLFAEDHQYQSIVYNLSNSETDLSNLTEVGNGRLRPMQSFWEQLISVLEDCRDGAKPMQFWYNEEDGKPAYITFRKFFINNNSEAFYTVDDLMMLEQADNEYVFNWAIEMNWRIFATALGICMPRYENRIPLISARFYAMYSQDFLRPLRQIWMSNRDNPVFQTILGNYYVQGKAERWTKVCMESSFVESGDRNYRPPRNLYVNAFTEMNYFLSGPLAGTSGLFGVVEGSTL